MPKPEKKRVADNAFESYKSDLKAKFRYQESREHAYRPALQNFIEILEGKIDAINDAARIQCGAPDFIVYKSQVPVGYIEAKDIDKNLDKEEKSEQIKGYHSLGNLILTDYLEFRWFVDGDHRDTVRIGKTVGTTIVFDENAELKLTQLFGKFLKVQTTTIKTASELAGRLALSTTSIRNLIEHAMELENEDRGWLHRWMKAFSEVLIHDLKKSDFADMFAQTLTYGFFAAWIHHQDQSEFSRFSAAKILPKTNPFLRKLFAQFAGVDMPETINWAVDEVVEILKRSDKKRVLTDFGKETGKEDPVVHFYETFLNAYDPKLRETRGVYYTPTPIVNYIVKSVDKILKKHYNRPKGLADDATLILDPAVGTASFLKQVIDQIHLRFDKSEGEWSSYVADNLLDRIFGFEILMAPYSVAHLKLGMQLQETGYKFLKDQRLGVFLTNTLEEAAKKSQELLFEWVSDEANSASSIKKDRPIMVVLGNPPYSGHSANNGKWISDLLNGYDGIAGKKTENYFECDGKPLGEKNSKWLNDDYVKFIRFAQWRIKQTGHGVLGFITNHGFLDNPTFRGMRHSLVTSFDELYVLDLHGNTKKKEICPDGSKDENVFDIQQGVSICFFVRLPGSHVRSAKVFRSDKFGLRDEKYDWLSKNDIDSTEWNIAEATTPFYLFNSGQNKSLESEFLKHPKLTEIMPTNVLGFQTHRDHFTIANTRDEIVERVIDLRSSRIDNSEIKSRYDLKENTSWRLDKVREKLKNDRDWQEKIVECLYRPFDNRFCFLHPAVTDRARRELVDHVMAKENLCLLASRQLATAGFRHSWISRLPAESCAISTKTKEQNYVFPLYLYQDLPLLKVGSQNEPELNIHNVIIEKLESAWNVRFCTNRTNKYASSELPAETILHYIYAILNSVTYRNRFEEFLKTDFARIPFTVNKSSFLKLAEFGKEIAGLHMLESPNIEEAKIAFPKKGDNIVEKLRHDPDTNRLYINQNQYFEGITRAMWDHRTGGYETLAKWLKDRPQSKLDYPSIVQFKKIVWICGKAEGLSAMIDKEVEKLGGWTFPHFVFNLSASNVPVEQLKTRVIRKLKNTIKKGVKISSRKKA